MQDATQNLKASQMELDKVNAAVAEQEAATKKIALALAEKGQTGGAALPSLPDNPSSLTVADLQSELKKHGLDTDWDPAKGKSVLVDRLTVCAVHLRRACAKLSIRCRRLLNDYVVVQDEIYRRAEIFCCCCCRTM